VSNGEFTPIPQTPQQKQVEARIGELAEEYGARQGLDRRRFLETSCGMATAFLAMNQVFGRVFEVSEAEAAQPEVAQARTEGLQGQFIFDVQSHFIRDDFNQEGLLGLGDFASKHWNPDMLKDMGLTLERYRFDNFLKEIYLDSETDLALLSGAPFDDPDSWLLTNEQGLRGAPGQGFCALPRFRKQAPPVLEAWRKPGAAANHRFRVAYHDGVGRRPPAPGRDPPKPPISPVKVRKKTAGLPILA
jgi:hypothetical protein